MKLTNHTYANNSWTHFKYEVDIMTGNKMIFAETCSEKFVKTHQVNLFLAGFSHLVPLCCIGQPIKITNQPDHDSVILASYLYDRPCLNAPLLNYQIKV